MLNIRTKAVEPTYTFQLCDANDEPLVNEDGTPCMWVGHGPGSKRYATAQARKLQRAVQKMQKGKAAALLDQAEFLADITDELGVSYADDSGRALEGREKFLAVYSDSSIGFIAEQVTEKASNWANFSRGSAKT